MINKQYDKLVKFLYLKELVAIGLYRLPGAADNKYPYVCTNPMANLQLTLRDRVFVLGHHIPRELIVENNRDALLGSGSERRIKGSGDFDHAKNKWSSFMQQENSQKEFNDPAGALNDNQPTY